MVVIVLFWIIASPIAALFCIWMIMACCTKRAEIKNKLDNENYFKAARRIISKNYPLTHFTLLAFLPFATPAVSLRLGSGFSYEEFTVSVCRVSRCAVIQLVAHGPRGHQASGCLNHNTRTLQYMILTQICPSGSSTRIGNICDTLLGYS